MLIKWGFALILALATSESARGATLEDLARLIALTDGSANCLAQVLARIPILAKERQDPHYPQGKLLSYLVPPHQYEERESPTYEHILHGSVSAHSARSDLRFVVGVVRKYPDFFGRWGLRAPYEETLEVADTIGFNLRAQELEEKLPQSASPIRLYPDYSPETTPPLVFARNWACGDVPWSVSGVERSGGELLPLHYHDLTHLIGYLGAPRRLSLASQARMTALIRLYDSPELHLLAPVVEDFIKQEVKAVDAAFNAVGSWMDRPEAARSYATIFPTLEITFRYILGQRENDFRSGLRPDLLSALDSRQESPLQDAANAQLKLTLNSDQSNAVRAILENLPERLMTAAEFDASLSAFMELVASSKK